MAGSVAVSGRVVERGVSDLPLLGLIGPRGVAKTPENHH
jgi:hypothetical protein